MNLDSDFGTNGEAGPDLTVKVFDFFSGCGRASSGFQDAGTDVVFGLDWDADAEQSFKRNSCQPPSSATSRRWKSLTSTATT